MKIKLIHTAQVVGARGKVEQHPPGKKLDLDAEQANRLIGAGYAKLDKAEETDEEPLRGTGGTGAVGGDAGSGGSGTPPGGLDSGTGGG